MKAASAFVHALSKYGTHKIGPTATHVSGVEYHHEHLFIHDAPYFMEKLWNAAAFELNGSYAYVEALIIDGVTYRHSRNPMKSGPRHRYYGCSVLVKHTKVTD